MNAGYLDTDSDLPPRSGDRTYACWGPAPEARTTLVCVPWAGAGAAPFAPWGEWLAPQLEVWATRLRGRESRMSEPPADDVADVVEELADRFPLEGRPYALFGHCSGAVIAFELAHELVRRGAPRPELLAVASQPPPDQPRTLEGWEDDVEALLRNCEADFDDDPAVREDLLFLVRRVIEADVRASRGYHYRPRPPLEVPIAFFVASDDAQAEWTTGPGWSRQTADVATRHVLDADHLFTGAAWRRLASTVADAVLSLPQRAATAA
jgi:surfactin synthase thioesterase subunit